MPHGDGMSNPAADYTHVNQKSQIMKQCTSTHKIQMCINANAGKENLTTRQLLNVAYKQLF